MKDINIAKLLIYLLLFLLISFIIVFLVVIPTVKDYKHTKKTYTNEKRLYNNISSSNNEAQKLLKSLKTEYNKEVSAFDKPFDIKHFHAHLDTFFDTVVLEDLNNTKEEGAFIVKEISAAVYISSPVKFQEFVDSLEQYQNVIKLVFPIKFEKENKELSTEFMLKVYEMK